MIPKLVMSMSPKRLTGFTLAELLIALAILGVIATFTIPKVLQSQQNQTYNSVTKEAVTSVLGALQMAQTKGTATTSTTMGDLTPYMNYVKYDTSGTQVDTHTVTRYNCGSQVDCIKLHSSAMIFFATNISFGGTGSTNAIYFWVDPDGQYTADPAPASRAGYFWVYWNGKLKSLATADSGTVFGTGVGTYGSSGPIAGYEPAWFSWN